MNITDLINLSSVFLDAPNDDGALTKIVEGRGYKTDVAERFVAFMPIAFGRVVINKIGNVTFTSSYKVDEQNGEFSLVEEPIYRLAYELATESYDKGVLEREVFSAIATRSAELNAVSKALNSGEDINDATFSTLRLFGFKTLGEPTNWFRRIFS